MIRPTTRNPEDRRITLALFTAAILCAIVFWLAGGLAAHAQAARGPNGDTLTDVSAGAVKEVCLTPTVTPTNAYGANFDVGGVLTFPNAFPPSGGGAIQAVYVDTAVVQSQGYTLTPMIGLPSSASTFTDATLAAISGLYDKGLPRGSIVLSGASVLGTHTAFSATQLGQTINVGAAPASTPPAKGTPFIAVLTSNGALTNPFATSGDLTICVDVVQFP